ncbi:hypothetical protein MRB53_004874 [Persea americana]|uniref:Uncharacterized protein n=1 Tax=Persea americana TaxID=3435 RepID=A0ACC2MBV1_PERAE|nr:hypothetical protein MRB53_004874 [Persea americana]
MSFSSSSTKPNFFGSSSAQQSKTEEWSFSPFSGLFLRSWWLNQSSISGCNIHTLFWSPSPISAIDFWSPNQQRTDFLCFCYVILCTENPNCLIWPFSSVSIEPYNQILLFYNLFFFAGRDPPIPSDLLVREKRARERRRERRRRRKRMGMIRCSGFRR